MNALATSRIFCLTLISSRWCPCQFAISTGNNFSIQVHNCSVLEIGEQHDDVFLVLVEAVEFTAECPAPLHGVDLETDVSENDALCDRLGTDEWIMSNLKPPASSD